MHATCSACSTSSASDRPRSSAPRSETRRARAGRSRVPTWFERWCSRTRPSPASTGRRPCERVGRRGRRRRPTAMPAMPRPRPSLRLWVDGPKRAVADVEPRFRARSRMARRALDLQAPHWTMLDEELLGRRRRGASRPGAGSDARPRRRGGTSRRCSSWPSGSRPGFRARGHRDDRRRRAHAEPRAARGLRRARAPVARAKRCG